MPVYSIKLIRKQEIAAGSMAFYFEKPPGFAFKAGQCGDFKLTSPASSGVEGKVRTFSLASAPYENELMFATRMRDSPFKNALQALPIGSELSVDAPHGSLTLHHDASIPAVFLSGGIGVTPVRSIVLQAAHERLSHKIFLFDSNKRPEDSVFLTELTHAQQDNPNYCFIASMTQMAQSTQQWSGETGFINKAMLEKYLDDLTQPIYYITGPQTMVEAMLDMLSDAGVDEDNIRTEEFFGY